MTMIRDTISHINGSTRVGLPLIRITLRSDDSWTAEMDIQNVGKPGIKRCGNCGVAIKIGDCGLLHTVRLLENVD